MKQFIVETSARHVHVTKEDLAALFGADAKLSVRKYLSQPGQFASGEKVKVVGPKGEMMCSILGPERKASQVELSLSEARKLGLTALIRESGDLDGTAGCKLVGPAGEVDLAQGVIAAKRHIHMTPADAKEFGVENGQIVSVKLSTPERSLIFGDTVVRVSDNYALAMHIDTDEANAAACSGEVMGEIVE